MILSRLIHQWEIQEAKRKGRREGQAVGRAQSLAEGDRIIQRWYETHQEQLPGVPPPPRMIDPDCFLLNKQKPPLRRPARCLYKDPMNPTAWELTRTFLIGAGFLLSIFGGILLLALLLRFLLP